MYACFREEALKDKEFNQMATNSPKQPGLVMLQHTDRCKGCGYCISACKAGALSFSATVNSSGNSTVERDAQKCTLCTLCYQVCPDYVFEFVDPNGADAASSDGGAQ